MGWAWPVWPWGWPGPATQGPGSEVIQSGPEGQPQVHLQGFKQGAPASKLPSHSTFTSYLKHINDIMNDDFKLSVLDGITHTGQGYQ
ncbi:hypothetical protein M378DRAFT_13423 [Amanita muscaria Koide BX008]|uniref:Uncharacterized protein n=1 Tax=Amanita muscaria (strain Koide BX008) TaxID=946122 RepID=A0A0C2WXR2_AMAMK|nr:hypothetical protein M378DRAFT_13423 [Amanita muscaria Koide BX008]